MVLSFRSSSHNHFLNLVPSLLFSINGGTGVLRGFSAGWYDNPMSIKDFFSKKTAWDFIDPEGTDPNPKPPAGNHVCETLTATLQQMVPDTVTCELAEDAEARYEVSSRGKDDVFRCGDLPEALDATFNGADLLRFRRSDATDIVNEILSDYPEYSGDLSELEGW